MDGQSEQSLPWTTIASHKIHASEYDTIYCKYSHPNRPITHWMLALLKATARMPEFLLVDKNIRQYHHIMTILYVPLDVPHTP